MISSDMQLLTGEPKEQAVRAHMARDQEAEPIVIQDRMEAFTNITLKVATWMTS